MQIIIYRADDGGIVEVHPNPEVLKKYSITDVAIKDVPHNKPFRIIDTSELPDISTRHLWTVDIKDLTHGVGGLSNEFKS